MTVTYADKSFLQLLQRWRGSIYKSIGLEYLIFLTLYFVINLSYRLAMDDDQRDIFERIVNLSEKGPSSIPLQFLLGFYVSSAVTRWWDQLSNVAWPDKLLVKLTANINGCDEESRKIRRTFARYSNLVSVLVWREISIKIKKRFPTERHLIIAGLMTEEEYSIYKETTPTHGRWFVPVSWMINLLARCRKEERISDYAYQMLLDELWTHRGYSAMLTMYDWVNIPLVYTQVVTIATYGYFAFCLVSRQTLLGDSKHNKDEGVDYLFPIFTSLEFIFYLGWMKVGEELRCPFGEDDEDFDMNYILDRNIHVANMLVDELNNQRPEPGQDKFWDDRYPVLPHTIASYPVRDRPPNWRLYKLTVSPELAKLYDESLAKGNSPLKRTQSEPRGKQEDDNVQLVNVRDAPEPPKQV